jgi:hypothetical protein
MNLKLKAKIYQYTGIYLAQKEEQEYINSLSETRKEHFSGLMVGLWQAKNGFYNQSYRYRSNTFLGKIVTRIVVIYKQLKQDLGL